MIRPHISWMLTAFALQSLSAATPVVPRVDLIYQPTIGTVFDRNCGELMKVTIDPDLVSETGRRTSEFQQWWDTQGPAYVKVAMSEVGLKFPFREVQATLTVCPVSSMSSPLLINVTPFLSKSDRKRPAWFFAFTSTTN